MKNLPKYVDIVFCVVVLPVMVMMFPIERWYHHFQTYVVFLGIWLYCLYFVNRFITVPFLFQSRNKRVCGMVLLVVSIGITYIFSSITLYTPPPSRFDEGITRIFPAVKQYQQAVWSLFMIVEAFSFAVGLLIQAERQRSRRREIEAERDRAEIDLYKARIKPHFMFNTLNSLYGLFLTDRDKALPTLEKFIQMMRYIHTTACQSFVSIAEETDYIRQLVDLQSLRLNEKTSVHLNIDIEDSTLNIPPMLLVTFVENCFKHGTSPVEKSSILISITERDKELKLQTCNKIFPVKRIGEHIGIRNCKKRLELSYSGRHTLAINNSDNMFCVELIIKLA